MTTRSNPPAHTASPAVHGSSNPSREPKPVTAEAYKGSLAEEWLKGARQDLRIVAPMIEVDGRGVAYLAGTTTKVTEVVLNQRLLDQPVQALLEDMPHLSLEQVQAALAYYADHKSVCDSQIEAAEEFARRVLSGRLS